MYAKYNHSLITLQTNNQTNMHTQVSLHEFRALYSSGLLDCTSRNIQRGNNWTRQILQSVNNWHITLPMVTFRQRHGYREPSLVIQGEPNDPSHVLFVDQWQCVTSISLINKYLISVLLRVNLDNLTVTQGKDSTTCTWHGICTSCTFKQHFCRH